MTPDLIKAHQDMGKAVMKAYRFDQGNMVELECVVELMKIYN